MQCRNNQYILRYEIKCQKESDNVIILWQITEVLQRNYLRMDGITNKNIYDESIKKIWIGSDNIFEEINVFFDS